MSLLGWSHFSSQWLTTQEPILAFYQEVRFWGRCSGAAALYGFFLSTLAFSYPETGNRKWHRASVLFHCDSSIASETFSSLNLWISDYMLSPSSVVKLEHHLTHSPVFLSPIKQELAQGGGRVGGSGWGRGVFPGIQCLFLHCGCSRKRWVQTANSPCCWFFLRYLHQAAVTHDGRAGLHQTKRLSVFLPTGDLQKSLSFFFFFTSLAFFWGFRPGFYSILLSLFSL